MNILQLEIYEKMDPSSLFIMRYEAKTHHAYIVFALTFQATE